MSAGGRRLRELCTPVLYGIAEDAGDLGRHLAQQVIEEDLQACEI